MKSVGLGLQCTDSLPDDVMLSETETIFILDLESNTISKEDHDEYERIKEKNKIYAEVSFNRRTVQCNDRFSWATIGKEVICTSNVVCKLLTNFSNMNISTRSLSLHEFVSFNIWKQILYSICAFLQSQQSWANMWDMYDSMNEANQHEGKSKILDFNTWRLFSNRFTVYRQYITRNNEHLNDEKFKPDEYQNDHAAERIISNQSSKVSSSQSRSMNGEFHSFEQDWTFQTHQQSYQKNLLWRLHLQKQIVSQPLMRRSTK